MIAAWLHDVASITDYVLYEEHHIHGAEMAHEILSKLSYDESDGIHWQFKICTQRSCLRTVCGTIKPPPHGVEIKKILAGIIGEENCYFF